MKLFFSLATGLLLCLVASVAQADLILGLAFDDASTSKTVTSGSTVLVDLFLTDTDASTPMSAAGLSTGGGRLVKTAGTAVVTDNLATVAGTNGAPNWFAITSPVAVPGISSALTVAPFLSTVGVGTTTIQIARFSLAVAGVADNTATITSDVLGGTFIGNTGIFPTNLDTVLTGGGGTFGSVSVTIAGTAPAPVPEPSTFVLATLGLLSLGMFGRRRRRR